MKRQVSIRILFCLSGAIILLLSLKEFTKMPNDLNNGFKRKFLPNKLELVDNQFFDLELNRINGLTRSHFYFSGQDPRWAIVTDKNLKLVDTLFFGLNPSEKLLSPNLTIDSPLIYMYANRIPLLIKGNVDEYKVDSIHLNTSLFTRFAQISPNLLVIRGFDSTGLHQSFKLIDCTKGETLSEVAIIENRNDAGISTDGLLNYDSSTHKITYVQMYQNRFLCLDTNLNLLYSHHTIDTNFTNKVSLSLLNQDNRMKLVPSESRKVVNEESTTENGYLYVASGLRSDNETISDFNKNIPIDMYNLHNGEYTGSFYIPKKKGVKMLAMRIIDQLLVVLYKGGGVATFHLPPVI